MISKLFILNRFTWGLNLHDLMNISNPLTFRVKTFQLSLSMKSQLNVNSSGPKRFHSKRKYFKIFTLLFIIPRTVLLSSIQLEAETLDFSTHALLRNL